MAEYKVHALVATRQGVDIALCGRLNPHQRTASWGYVTCQECKWKMQDLERERAKDG